MKTIVVEVPDELWELLEPIALEQNIPAERYILDMMLKVNPPRPQLSEEERQNQQGCSQVHSGGVYTTLPFPSAGHEKSPCLCARTVGERRCPRSVGRQADASCRPHPARSASR